MTKRRGRIQAYLDEDVLGSGRGDVEDLSGEVDRAALEASLARTRFVRGLIAAAPVAEVDTQVALAQVYARLDRRDAAPHGPGTRGTPDALDVPVRVSRPAIRRNRIAWAASLVLLLGSGAAAAALPGSPVRSWLEGLAATPSAAVEAGPQVHPPVAATTAASLTPSVDQFVVSIGVLPPSTAIRVRLVPGGRVTVDAPAGTLFTSGSDRIEVRPTPGLLRVDLPLELAHAVVRVEGRVLLERVGGEVVTTDERVQRQGDAWLISGGGP